jgi:CheY-like chemotaxis protein
MARIFLIDDDHDLPQLTKVILSEKGHAVYIFHEAESAMEDIKINKPDLIIMDMMLPGMSGPDAIREMKHNPKLKDIPVIFLSGLISARDKELLETGINVDGVNYKILSKPYDAPELLALVKDLVD